MTYTIKEQAEIINESLESIEETLPMGMTSYCDDLEDDCSNIESLIGEVCDCLNQLERLMQEMKDMSIEEFICEHCDASPSHLLGELGVARDQYNFLLSEVREINI